MISTAFKAAHREIVLCTGAKSTALRPVTDFHHSVPHLIREEAKWTKSNTPHRIILRHLENGATTKAVNSRTNHSALKVTKRSHSLEKMQNLMTVDHQKHYPRSTSTLQQSTPVIIEPRQQQADKQTNTVGPVCLVPLPTLIVKWQLKFKFSPYTLSELKCVMSRYGKVVSVYRLQINSAVVVFKELGSARRAVSSKTLGKPYCRLSCQWLYPALSHADVFAAMNNWPEISIGSH